MTVVYKLIFDIAFYFGLTGFYFRAFSGREAYFIGFLACAAAISVYAVLVRFDRLSKLRGVETLVIPLIALFFAPTVGCAVHMLPAAAYLGYCFWTGRTGIEYAEAGSHIARSLLFFIAPTFCMLIVHEPVACLTSVVPYITIMLCSAICLLRMLREQKQNGLQQVWIIGGFTLFCVLFTVENIPQLIGSALHLFAEYVIFPLLMVAIGVLGFLFYGFVQVLVWLMLLLRGEEPGPLQVDNRGMAEVLHLEEFVDEGGSSPFLRYLGYFLLILLVGGILYLLLRFLLGEKETEPEEQVIRETTTKLPSQKVQNHSLLPPRDPRLQVRWYYAKFLRECKKRHVFFAPGDTTADIAQKCSFAFPECDPQILRRLYLPARYSMKTTITRADAEAAASAWHALKKSKAPY